MRDREHTDYTLTNILIRGEKRPITAETLDAPHHLLNHTSAGDLDTLLFISNTINSVNRTLEHNIYALNTTISDLIKLTNKLLTDRHILTDPSILFWSVSTLLRMLAPIAPSFTEKCWASLHQKSVRSAFCENHWPGSSKSVFDAPFPSSPVTPEALSLLQSRRISVNCAVQVNGKLRFSMEIAPHFWRGKEAYGKDSGEEEEEEEEEKERFAELIAGSEEGKYWLTEKNQWEKRKRFIVVHKPDGSKLVNVVF